MASPPGPGVLSAVTAASVAASVATSAGRPSSSLVKWTLPISLLVTVLGFWWHSSRKKPKPPGEDTETTEAKESRAVVGLKTAACNGAASSVKLNGVCKVPPTDNPDLNAFIETVYKLNAGILDSSALAAKPTTNGTLPNGHCTTPVTARSKRSAPQPCTPPSVEKQVVAKSFKYAEAGTSVLDTLEFGVAKIENKQKAKSPTAGTNTNTSNTSPVKKLWSELVEEDSDNESPVPVATARARPTEEELQFSVDHLVSSSDVKSPTAAAGSPPCCDSTTVDTAALSLSPRDYHDTKSYSESAANAEVADIITQQQSPLPGTNSSGGIMSESRAGRDSANHSPSVEDMEHHHPSGLISSPSLSDVHSEGSSDSGKGCSEEGSSRTPAGGSSVSGDAHPTTPTPYDTHSTGAPGAWTEYHFILPQHMVGRLIGKEGVFIHRIRNQTNTKMFIKRHPTSHKLKVCAIEGVQENIDQALAMIRQKFSLSQYPHLSMEKVDYVVPKVISCALRPEPFQLTLVEGINNDVCISSLVSAAHFFVQLPSHPTFIGLEPLNLLMNQTYCSSQAPLLPAPVENALVAAPAMGGWFRAQITSVDTEGCLCSVRFVDYGGYMTLPTQELRQIRADFLRLPFQAIECGLANILPVEGEDKDSSVSCEAESCGKWSEEALSLVHGLTRDQIVQAQVYDYDVTSGMPLVYLYGQYNSEFVLVNQELVMRGYAKLDPGAALLVSNSTADSKTTSSISSPEETPVAKTATSDSTDDKTIAPSSQDDNSTSSNLETSSSALETSAAVSVST